MYLGSSGKPLVFVVRPPLSERLCSACAQSPRPNPGTERVVLSLQPGPWQRLLASSSRTIGGPFYCSPRGEAGSPFSQTVMRWRWARLLAAPVRGKGSLQGTKKQGQREGAAKGEKGRRKIQSKRLWGSGSGSRLAGKAVCKPQGA